jgi:hypothetical protein
MKEKTLRSKRISRRQFISRTAAASAGVFSTKFFPSPASGQNEVDFDKIKAVPLFEGKTFKGWDGNLKWFRIEDGAIVAGSLEESIPQNEWLATTTEYVDFELRLKAKLLNEKGNAGIQVRSSWQGSSGKRHMRGYQADIGGKSGQYDNVWGCLYDEHRRNTMLACVNKKAMSNILKPGDWNEYVVRCLGDRIQLWLHGHQTVDFTETDAIIEVGGDYALIALQIHSGQPSEVWYKDISIKDVTG